jgi:hydroxymethylbilane synthase
LRDGKYDAILLAAAGVTRLELDLSDLHVISLDPEQFLPAPAQGILGIQIRDNDPAVESVIAKLGSAAAMLEANLERGLLARFDSGCSLPLGVFSEVRDGQLRLKAVLGTREGDQWTGLKRTDITGTDVDDVISRAYDALRGSPACRD